MATLATNTFASESQHWYRLDGSPAYTVIGKNGKERATTLRDARELNLCPSVTTVMGVAAKPGLENWKMTQFGLALMTLPKLPDESIDDFIKRAQEDAKQEAINAAAGGTDIHGAIECFYQGKPYPEEFRPWVKRAAAVIEEHCGVQQWASEKSFAYLTPRAHGGKVDLHSQFWTIDIKTKEGNVETSPQKLWDEHPTQVGTYRRGLRTPGARGAILFIGRDEPSAQLVEIPEDDLQKGVRMFDHLLGYWYEKTGLRHEG